MPSTHAIVLSKENFGEADRYILFLTKQWGVISVLAKSARKSKRRFVGGLDLFCHDEISIRGDPKEKPYLVELSVLNNFSGIRDRLNRLETAGKALQWIRQLSYSFSPIPNVYSLLGQTLTLIENEEYRFELLNLIFRLRLLRFLGFEPRFKECLQCEGKEILLEGAHFDIARGGLVCLRCVHSKHEDFSLRRSEVDLFHFSSRLKWSEWKYCQSPSENPMRVLRILTHFASYHTHMKLPH